MCSPPCSAARWPALFCSLPFSAARRPALLCSTPVRSVVQPALWCSPPASLLCCPLARPLVQHSGPLCCAAQHQCAARRHVLTSSPPFCATRHPAANSCFHIGNTALQPARPPFGVIPKKLCKFMPSYNRPQCSSRMDIFYH